MVRHVAAAIQLDGHPRGVRHQPGANPVVHALAAERRPVRCLVHEDHEAHVERGHEDGTRHVRERVVEPRRRHRPWPASHTQFMVTATALRRFGTRRISRRADPDATRRWRGGDPWATPGPARPPSGRATSASAAPRPVSSRLPHAADITLIHHMSHDRNATGPRHQFPALRPPNDH